MGLTAKDKGDGNFELIPEGLHTAICFAVIDLGTQYSQMFDKAQQKVCIMWEFPDLLMEDSRPFVISNIYTLSLHKKSNLRQHLESWRGKSFTDEELAGFDLTVLIGIPCQIQVVHNHKNENTYANISTIVNAPKGYVTQPLYNGTYIYEITAGILPEHAPDWIKEIIQKAEEWKTDSRQTESEPEQINDIEPF
jgi:hypothetical protein